MNEPTVRAERTGWRDESLSRRHREWGFNCPAVDLDFLMVEYNIGLPVALVEYKHHRAMTPNLLHPTYRALRDLADGYRGDGLPFLIAFYWTEPWAFRVTPVNGKAKEWFANGEVVSERTFVTRLYLMRTLTIRDEVVAKLSDRIPSDAAAA